MSKDEVLYRLVIKQNNYSNSSLSLENIVIIMTKIIDNLLKCAQ